MQGPSPQHFRQLLFPLRLPSAPDFLRADTLNLVSRFHVLRFLPIVASGCHCYLLPARDTGHSAVPLVWRASDRARCPLGIRDDRCGFC